MAVRDLQIQDVSDFFGVNYLDDKENLPPSVWFAGTNVVVSASGSALALRSPLTVTKTIGNPSARILSIFNAIWSDTATVFFDIQAAGTTSVTTYRFATQFGIPATPSSVRTGQADHRVDRINTNNKVYNVNGAETFQYVNSTTSYQLGIGKPLVAGTTSIVAGGALVLNVGATASYAYRNAATTHVGLCSAASSNSGPTNGANQTLRVAVVAASTTGIDGIVLFLSKDGESNRYLNVDSSGNMLVYPNTTGNIDISTAYFVDTNTPETAYNYRPLDSGTQVSAWQDRLWITGFGAGTLGPTLTYSGYESVYAGVPQEAFPPLNVVTIPAKTEVSQTSIPTPVGLLIFSDLNAYLLTGNPQDNAVAPSNTLAVTAQLDSLNWNLGTKSPNSVVSSPFGIIWLDNNKRIQLWPFQGLPQEIGLALRPDLSNIFGSGANLALAEAVWYQGKDAAYYILTACTSGSVNNRLYIIGFYTDPGTGNVVRACSTSDISASCINVSTLTQIVASGKVFIGGTTDIVQQIFDFDTQGSGFGAGTTLSFDLMAGNNIGNYSNLHSLRFDSNTNDVMVQVSNPDGSDQRNVMLTREGNTTYKGLVNKYGIRQMLRFVFPTDDAVKRDVKNFRLAYSQKKRVL